MTSPIEDLHQLTREAKKGDPIALCELQTRLYPGFKLAIHRVLRTGRGKPELTNWVSRALRSLPESQLEDPCEVLTRMLCNDLASPRFTSEHGMISSAETVVELAI